jgi:hypothetical protein
MDRLTLFADRLNARLLALFALFAARLPAFARLSLARNFSVFRTAFPAVLLIRFARFATVFRTAFIRFATALLALARSF